MTITSFLQDIGRSLMLPIAVLPVAALLLRLGQPDLLDIAFMADAGNAIFQNLGLLFAIGVGIGLAKDNHGAAAIAGIVCFLVAKQGAEHWIDVGPQESDLLVAALREQTFAKLSTPLGIISGIIAGISYNRFHDIKLPEFLAFFSGRRFVPIICGLAGIALAAILGATFDILDNSFNALADTVVAADSFGLFAYGVLNRALIATGMHHILNNVVWFNLGEFAGATGDLPRFFASDPTAGAFMAGFFPVMMFGLPAACLAMLQSVPKKQRSKAIGFYGSIAFASLLTGVTEPVEFSFMFAAPVLYGIHAILTGISLVVMDLLGIKLGFGFSAGLLDYLLNFGLATKPLLLLPVGACYFAIYYASFRVAISRFGISVPGFEPEPETSTATNPSSNSGYIEALGGSANILDINACTTRLRLRVKSSDAVNDEALKALGARGVIRPSADTVQVIIGSHAEQLADELRTEHATSIGNDKTDFVDLSAALGGSGNIQNTSWQAGRLRITLANPALINTADLDQFVPKGWRILDGNIIHLLLNETDVHLK